MQNLKTPRGKDYDRVPKRTGKIDKEIVRSQIIFLGEFKRGFARVKNEVEKENFMTKNNKLLLKVWADAVTDFNESGEATVVYLKEGKEYFINEKGEMRRKK